MIPYLFPTNRPINKYISHYIATSRYQDNEHNEAIIKWIAKNFEDQNTNNLDREMIKYLLKRNHDLEVIYTLNQHLMIDEINQLKNKLK